MPINTIPTSLLDFLKDLQENNNREWFNTNKPRYQAANEHMKAFVNELMNQMSFHDNIEAVKVFRIYRDVRFSKNKAPYKNNFGGSMKRATKLLRGGYYFHIEPGNSFVAGGFWAPNSQDLKRIRTEIAADDKPLRKIINDPVFIETFGELGGEGVKTAPKGFSKEHPAIDLIRKKQFVVSHKFTDEEVLADDFMEKLVKCFLAMRPFFDYMSEVLTTDENGVPIV